jgi:hypothetical protein
MFAYLAVVFQQRVYMLQYFIVKNFQILINHISQPEITSLI